MFRDTFYMLLYLSILAINTLTIIYYNDNYWVMPICIFIQGVIFVGFMEGFHQTIHSNLFSIKIVNNIFGFIFGAFLGISFVAYKRFHIKHHATSNTSKDPEKLFYRNKLATYKLLLFPFAFLLKTASIVNKGNYLKEQDSFLHNLAMKLNTLFPLIPITLTIFFPKIMLFTYWLPYLVFFYVEIFMSQSQHYFSVERESALRSQDQYKDSVNILLPWPLGFLCLYTNHHATHHVQASLKWYDTPKRTKLDSEKVFSMNFLKFIALCISKGTRHWKINNVEVTGK